MVILESAVSWGNILTQVILGVVGVVLSALGTYVTYFVSKKIKDEKLKSIMESLNSLVSRAVLEVYQTYVQELKDKDIFDEEAQKKALDKALKIIKEEMPVDVATWVRENHEDIDTYLKTLIESTIALLKK